MKAWAIIFTCMFFISLIGFTVTAAVTGVDIINDVIRGNYTWDSYDVTRTFESDYSNIEIGVLSARTNITLSSDGITRVNYTGNKNFSNVEFTAEISGNTLIIKEKGNFAVIGWNWGWNLGFSRNGGQTTLDIELPQEAFGKIDINLTSGRINAELPETDNLYVNITSGNVTLNYNHDNIASHLKSHATSGTITINGFAPETFDIYSTSGRQNITGLAGSGSVRLTSGSANIDFAEWNGSLNVKITSGNATITVPAGSGADFRFSRTSGSLRYNMDGDSGRMNSSGSASAGGSNRQRVDVDLTSGSAEIKTR